MAQTAGDLAVRDRRRCDDYMAAGATLTGTADPGSVKSACRPGICRSHNHAGRNHAAHCLEHVPPRQVLKSKIFTQPQRVIDRRMDVTAGHRIADPEELELAFRVGFDRLRRALDDGLDVRLTAIARMR